MAKVSLKLMLEAMESAGDLIDNYIHRQTGKIVMVSDDDIAALRHGIENAPDWHKAALPEIQDALESEDYLALPGRFEIDDYTIMKRFCQTVEDERQQDQLFDAIQGKGAFSRFQRAVDRLGLADRWYAFHEEAYRKLAIEWLTENGFDYQE